MPRQSGYMLMPTKTSKCPKGHLLELLMADGKPRLPAFYICFTCQFVGQAGVGEVQREGA